MRYFAASFLMMVPLWFSGPSRVSRLVFEELQGVDVSHHQKHIDWDTVAVRGNVDFAFVKATEGGDFIDTLFCQNWEDLHRTGLRRGAYHFFRSYGCGDVQAQHYLSTVELAPGDLVPVLDIETTDGMPQEVIIQEAQIWLKTVEEYLQVKPIIYTNQYFYDRYLAGHFDEYPLWIARYSGTQPILDNGKRWHIWQYSNTGLIPGIPKEVDLNLFIGTPEMLDRFCWFPKPAVETEAAVAP